MTRRGAEKYLTKQCPSPQSYRFTAEADRSGEVGLLLTRFLRVEFNCPKMLV